MGDKGFTDGQKFTIPIQISFQASCDIFLYSFEKDVFKGYIQYCKKNFFKSDGLTLLEDFLFRIQIGAQIRIQIGLISGSGSKCNALDHAQYCSDGGSLKCKIVLVTLFLSIICQFSKVFRSRYSHPESIRGKFGLTDTRNSSHGSDSPDNAAKAGNRGILDF